MKPNRFKKSLQLCVLASLSFLYVEPSLALTINFQGIDFYLDTSSQNCFVLQNGIWNQVGTLQQCLNYINRNNSSTSNRNNSSTSNRNNSSTSNSSTSQNRRSQPRNTQTYYCSTIGQYCSYEQYLLDQQYKQELNNKLDDAARFGR
jgi:hypothetical protein